MFKNSNNIEIDVISYGGIIICMLVFDVKGQLGNIVYGFDLLLDYEIKNLYFGVLIGCYGNCIKDVKFLLFGIEYQLVMNDGDNYFYGGVQGFDKKVWSMELFVMKISVGVKLMLVSLDGDQGYFGELIIVVIYMLIDDNMLDMQFIVMIDVLIIVNLIQYMYFNFVG